MQAPAPSDTARTLSSSSRRMSSVMVVEGASLTKRNGGGVRSRVMLSCLQDLGDVDVISIATKDRHVARIPKVDGVRSHEIVVVRDRKWSDIRQMIAAVLRGAKVLPAQSPTCTEVGDKIAALIKANPETQLVALRYFGAWHLASLDGHAALERCAVWLDLDDREDKIVEGKLLKSGFGPIRALAPKVATLKKSQVAAAARASDLCSLASASDVPDLAQNANVIELANVVPAPETLANKPSEGQDILFVGAYSWPPNIDAIEWFIANCWDRIRAAHPQASLSVVGAGKQSTRDALAAKHKARAGITWHFDVPDLAPFYASARMVISPVEMGSGSKIKVIEAAAYGRPTIVTPHSARGMAAGIAEALAVAETGAAFADACAMYLGDPERADADGAALRAAQIRHHSVDAFKSTAYAALSRAVPALDIPNVTGCPSAHTPQQINEVQQ